MRSNRPLASIYRFWDQRADAVPTDNVDAFLKWAGQNREPPSS
jgi:hypothetical protein